MRALVFDHRFLFSIHISIKFYFYYCTFYFYAIISIANSTMAYFNDFLYNSLIIIIIKNYGGDINQQNPINF